MKVRADGYFLNEKPDSSQKLVEYDFSKSPTLKVPGDWNSQRDSLFFYEGTVWYEKTRGARTQAKDTHILARRRGQLHLE